MKYEIIQNIMIGLLILAIIGAFIGLVSICLSFRNNHINTYTLIGTTKMYSDVSSTLIIEDNSGKLWSFTSYKLPMSIPLDTVCAMIVNDNKTENFDDDYIIDVIFKNG